MVGLSSRVPDQPVALALYYIECQFRTLSSRRSCVKRGDRARGRDAVAARPTGLRCENCTRGSRHAAARQGGAMSIDALITRMTAIGEELSQAGDARQAFHATYLRTTRAVANALRAGVFDDADWVERWDVAFADLYLDALDAARNNKPVPRPWAVAFSAAADRERIRPALQHVLLGMNAHINFDLPQALLAVISDDEFGDPALLARREADHRKIDEVLSARVRAEDAELRELATARSWRDDVLQPLNRAATRRFLRESRAKVWANAEALSGSRRQGDRAYAARLGQLEELSAARVADLVRPGPVLLRLATRGFGVRLEEVAGPANPDARPTTAPPATAPPATARSTARPTTARPATARPTTAPPATAPPAAARPTTARLATGRLAALRQTAARLAAGRPATAPPATAPPATARPTTAPPAAAPP